MLGFILADIKRHFAGVLVVTLLVALATGLGVAVTLQERAIRLGSARAAAPFDLLVGAPGSETQLMLSSVFLQPAPLPLIPPEVLAGLRADSRVAWAAPVGFGDFAGDDPIVGTSRELVASFGALSLGRLFDRLNEVVIGARVDRSMGTYVKPMHGRAQDGGRIHGDVSYRVVGQMVETGTPWDWAIFVPIETVWALHGEDDQEEQGAHGEGLAMDESEDVHALHNEFDRSLNAQTIAEIGRHGVPAILVKPRSIADAYKLRQEYRNDRTLAVFPGEVLTRLYGTLGDARIVLRIVALSAQALVSAAILLLVISHVLQRRRQIGALRAFGAPRRAILAIVWLETFAITTIGLIGGFVLGFIGAQFLSVAIGASTRMDLPVEFNREDMASFGLLVLVTAVAALLPSLLAYRQSASESLRS